MPNWVPPLEHSETIEGCKCLHYNFSTFKDFIDLDRLAALWLVRRTEGGGPIQDPDPLNNPSRAPVPLRIIWFAMAAFVWSIPFIAVDCNQQSCN